MRDDEAISEAVFHYCEGYRSKDRTRLERAFALDVAIMSGYTADAAGKLRLFSKPMRAAIDDWTAPDYEPFDFGDGRILALDVFSDVGATVLFDFGGRYLESYQLAKIDGTWRIVSKFIVDP